MAAIDIGHANHPSNSCPKTLPLSSTWCNSNLVYWGQILQHCVVECHQLYPVYSNAPPVHFLPPSSYRDE